MGKPVFQFKLDGEFVTEHPSREAAAKVMGCNESSIRKVIDKDKASCGFKWRSYNSKYSPGKVVFDDSNFALASSKAPDPKHVKILLIDIETAPVKALVWKMWKENIGVDQVLSDWFCLTWAAKWLGDSEVFSNKLTSDEVLAEDDKRIIKEMWKLFDDADIIIGHNSKNFDVVKLNTRFVVHGLVPPSPYKQVDTLEVARKEFGFSSNKLQHLANSFGIEGKYETGFNLWKKCLEGDVDSLYYMEHYNKHDVEILEEVYLKLRPYIKGHPNLDMYFNDVTPHCPICGKHNLILVPDKNFYTQAVEYQVYRCEDCGGLSRAKKGNKILNKKVISAIPR